MTENQINTKSPEYKQGYKEGILHTTILGVTCTCILTGIGLYAIHQLANSNKNCATIEQKIGSEKADEMMGFTRFIMFDADEDTIKQYKKECMGPYSVDKEKCMTMHPIEIANCKRQSEDLDAKLKQMKCEDGVVNDCMEPYYKKHDDCKEVIFEKAYKRFKEQRNIPKRR